MYSIKKEINVSITWKDVSIPFMQSINAVIPYAILNSDNKIDILVTSVKPLTETMAIKFEYDTLVRLAKCISRQILYMEKRGITLVGLELSDILVVNQDFFVANYKRVVSYSESMIRFITPFYKPTFTSKEIKGLVNLPCNVSYLTAHYSLASLIVFLLGGDSNNSKVDSIKYTKLYWFLKRCFLNEGTFEFV
jgi:hypothetical protein